MKFIIEFEGAIADVAAAHYEAHKQTAAEVGWSSLDRATFWRLTRTKGREANFLPGAREGKTKEYLRRFDDYVESEEVQGKLALQTGMHEVLDGLQRRGPCLLITLGSNLDARRGLMQRTGLTRYFERIESLQADPRLRPGELRHLAGGDVRTVVVASTDTLLRAAGRAELVVVGLSSGSCAIPRLNRAGADIVYAGLSDFLEALSAGSEELVRAGLLPSPLG